MFTAGFVSSSEVWHWERQFPTPNPIWDDVEFVFEGDFSRCDIVFVYDGLGSETHRRLKVRRAAFIAGEPQSVKRYDKDFLGQFDFVLTTDRSTEHPNVSFGQLALPWHVGAWSASHELLEQPMSYQDLADWQPEKTKMLSVISSNKAFTAGHRLRLEFVARLKKYFGDEIDCFGRNIRSFGDKIEVLGDYRYHIAIENSSFDDYWTEKLSDSFLAASYPIYYGAPNIFEYFPENSLSRIDINDPDAAIKTIKDIIEFDAHSKRRDILKVAKTRVLDDYNLFSVLSNLTKKLCQEVRPGRKIVNTEKFFLKNRHKTIRNIRRWTGL